MEQKKGRLSHIKALQKALEQARRITGTGLTEAGKQLTAMVAEAVREGVHRLVGLLEALVLHLPTKDAAARKSLAEARQTKKGDDVIAAAQQGVRAVMDETAQTQDELREGLAELDDEESQKGLEQAIIMSACPGSPTRANPPEFPAKADQFFRSSLAAEEKKRLGWLMGRLGGDGGEAKLLQGAALALNIFLPEEGEWDPECFRVDHEKSLGENIAVGFLNGFLPRRERELDELLKALENAGDEEVPVGDDEKLGLKALLLTIRDLGSILPKSLPAWAKKLYDETRAKRLKPQNAEQPKTKPVPTELPIVTKIKTFVSFRGLKLDEGARKHLFSAVEAIKKGGEVAEPLKWLTAAQKGLPDEIAKEISALMEGVRKHYHQQKEAAKAKIQEEKPASEPKLKKPQPLPLKKEDVVAGKSDREVVRWLTDQILARWDDLTDDETRRRLMRLAFSIQRIVPMRVVMEEVEALEKELGEPFAVVFTELRERYEADRAKTYASCLNGRQACQAAKTETVKTVEAPKTETPAPEQAPSTAEKAAEETPASPAGLPTNEVSEPEPVVAKPPTTGSVGKPAEPPRKSPRFKWEDFGDAKDDAETVKTLKVFARSNRNALGKPAGGHIKKAMEALVAGESAASVLKHVRAAQKAAGGHTLGGAFSKLEKAVEEHYELLKIAQEEAATKAAAPATESAGKPVEATETK